MMPRKKGNCIMVYVVEIIVLLPVVPQTIHNPGKVM
jgi:hypothetical protein